VAVGFGLRQARIRQWPRVTYRTVFPQVSRLPTKNLGPKRTGGVHRSPVFL
jgi:hypothetical protein